MKKQVVNFGQLSHSAVVSVSISALSPDGTIPWSTGSQAEDEDGEAAWDPCPSAG